ncbi:hypothetical protein MLD38_029294 [Melastoma candidum]|uniref:Uncharacterized protein n=1 Tax=Melastoma candidum TaxID=119954 RepID=A0ACB9N461_9MYRT|nr:hypothetical protein MLD38_029294 [Melastoma candidum]
MALGAVLVPNPVAPFHRLLWRRGTDKFRAFATLRQASRGFGVEDRKQPDVIDRRSANWPPNIWDYEFLGSLGTEYGEERFVEQINDLKGEVKGMIGDGHMRASDKLVLIDAVQRLGLGSHFETEIMDAIGLIRELHPNGGGPEFDDLYSDALLFRLSRQHGFQIRQGKLIPSQAVKNVVYVIVSTFSTLVSLSHGFRSVRKILEEEFRGLPEEVVVKGVLSLYEASFYGIKGEFVMDEARIVAFNFLKSLDFENLESFPGNLAKKVQRALDMPIRLRSNRSEARWFMDIYEHDTSMKPNLLRMAKLDYNLVQSYHRTEVAQLSSWWLDLGVERFEVLRDRLMENYLWNNIISFEPRWDISDIDKLPPVIRAAYLALYNSTNESAYQVMRDQGVNILPHLQMMWSQHCMGYLREAKWYNSGYIPNFQEYISNGAITIGSFIMLFSYFVGMANYLDKEALDFACNIPSIVYNSSLILRLNNDLATSPYELERGDNLKGVQCYENEHGVSNAEAREAIRAMVEEAWKSMNQQEFEKYPSFVSKDFRKACLGIAQASQFFYQYGDGHGRSDKETKDYIKLLLVESVPI